MAMCITPFSGPSQRSCPSQISSRAKPPRSSDETGDVPADDVGRQRPHRGAGDVVAPAGGEEQRVPRRSGSSVLQHQVGGGVVGLGFMASEPSSSREVGNRTSSTSSG